MIGSKTMVEASNDQSARRLGAGVARRARGDVLSAERIIIRLFVYIRANIYKTNNNWFITSTDGREISAKCIVIANGSNTILSQKFNLGPKNLHYASTATVRLNGSGFLKKGTSIFDFGLVKYGFAWAFPLEDSVNVGVGSFIGNQSLESKNVLTKLLPSIGFNPNDGLIKHSNLRVWNGHSRLNGDGVVAVGDAASLCDPFLAEGLRPSIMSGYEASKSLSKFLKGESKDLSSYTNSMRILWGESMAWGRRISQVFYRFPRIGYQLGIKRPTAPQRIAQILSGEMGYGDIAQRVIKRLLLQK